MTLADETVERYSRHILVPEIGPDGQRRLLETRVVVAGTALAGWLAADLLERSGLAVVADVASADAGMVLGESPTSAWPRPTVIAWASGHRLDAAFLAGAPCTHCFRPATAITEPRPDALAHALAALAVTTLIIGMLGPRGGSSLTTLDLDAGRFARTGVDGPECEQCRASA